MHIVNKISVFFINLNAVRFSAGTGTGAASLSAGYRTQYFVLNISTCIV